MHWEDLEAYGVSRNRYMEFIRILEGLSKPMEKPLPEAFLNTEL